VSDVWGQTTRSRSCAPICRHSIGCRCGDRHATRDTPSAGVKWRAWPLTDPIAQNQRKWRHAKSIAAREPGY